MPSALTALTSAGTVWFRGRGNSATRASRFPFGGRKNKDGGPGYPECRKCCRSPADHRRKYRSPTQSLALEATGELPIRMIMRTKAGIRLGGVTQAVILAHDHGLGRTPPAAYIFLIAAIFAANIEDKKMNKPNSEALFDQEQRQGRQNYRQPQRGAQGRLAGQGRRHRPQSQRDAQGSIAGPFLAGFVAVSAEVNRRACCNPGARPWRKWASRKIGQGRFPRHMSRPQGRARKTSSAHELAARSGKEGFLGTCAGRNMGQGGLPSHMGRPQPEARKASLAEVPVATWSKEGFLGTWAARNMGLSRNLLTLVRPAPVNVQPSLGHFAPARLAFQPSSRDFAVAQVPRKASWPEVAGGSSALEGFLARFCAGSSASEGFLARCCT